MMQSPQFVAVLTQECFWSQYHWGTSPQHQVLRIKHRLLSLLSTCALIIVALSFEEPVLGHPIVIDTAQIEIKDEQRRRKNLRISKLSSFSLGFDEQRDSFSFSNWAGLTTNDALTYARMSKLFSKNATCTEDPLDASCTLRTGKRFNLSVVNSMLASGRCEGMTVLAARLFRFPTEIARLDSLAKTTNDLSKDATAEEIAFYSISQLLPEIQGFSGRTRFKAPLIIFREIAFKMKIKRAVSLGIYGDGFAHSVLPVAISLTPRETVVVVYDPNFPEQLNTLKLNNLRNQWTYDKAVLIDGSVGSISWKGTGRLDYVPIDLRPSSE